jgi:hypothetical protein
MPRIAFYTFGVRTNGASKRAVVLGDKFGDASGGGAHQVSFSINV